MIRRRLRSRKGPGAFEYTCLGILIGFFLAGLCIKTFKKNEAVKILSPISEVQATASATPVVIDNRADKLERFFIKYNSPLATLSAQIVRYADDYKIDYRVVPVISGIESTFCQNRTGVNNCWGYGPHFHFATLEAGIKKVSWQIGTTDYYKEWQANPSEYGLLARVYNEGDEKKWEADFNYFIDQIE